jgi:hypothetical protein
VAVAPALRAALTAIAQLVQMESILFLQLLPRQAAAVACLIAAVAVTLESMADQEVEVDLITLDQIRLVAMVRPIKVTQVALDLMISVALL